MEDIPITKEEYIAMVKTINQLRKEKQQLIDKACEWLEDKLPLYCGQVNADNTDRFIRLFKKYMEEQQ